MVGLHCRRGFTALCARCALGFGLFKGDLAPAFSCAAFKVRRRARKAAVFAAPTEERLCASSSARSRILLVERKTRLFILAVASLKRRALHRRRG
jgi:hypothetical protein